MATLDAVQSLKRKGGGVMVQMAASGFSGTLMRSDVALTHPLLVRKAEEVSINDLRVRCVWNTIPRIISIFPPLPRNSWPCM